MARFAVRAKGPLEALLRLIGLALVMGLAVYGFWKNSERTLERITAGAALADETASLSEDQRAHVRAFTTAMRQRYGVETRLQVTDGPLAPPEQDGKTLYIGLAPARGEALVRLPPLMAGALGQDFSRQLSEEHFPFHFAPGRDWRKGLLLALDLLESRLSALHATDSADTTNATPPSGGDKDMK